MKGGLGNQLFQYAFGMKMEREFGARVLFDTRGLRNANSPREFELSNFNFFSKNKKKFIFDWNSNLMAKSISSIYHHLGREYKESEEFKIPGIYSGFWQSSKYLDFLVHGGIKEIEFSESIVNEFGMRRKPSEVALHIRGTDFLQDKNCKNLTWDYYEKGLRLLNYSKNTFAITIFTDDPQYVEEFVPKEIPYTLSNSKSAFQDLLRLSQFANMILANSTFSLWAGYLSQYSEGKIIVPEIDYFFIKNDIFKPDWTVIY